MSLLLRQHLLNLGRLLLVICVQYGCASTKTTAAEDQLLGGSVVSCGHMNIYQLSEDNKSYLLVIINTKKMALSRENSWDLTAANDNIRVIYRQYEEDISNRLCNDVSGRRIKPIQEIEIKSGTLLLNVTDAEWGNYKNGMRYKVDLSARNLGPIDEKTYTIMINQTSVGWLPG